MKKSDLYREWARVLDMCEGTNVSPNICWGFEGIRTYKCAPELIEDPNGYEFAVGILEDKPVFVGDRVWSEFIDDWYIITNAAINFNCMSWNPKKKTFMLNGEELPCPIKDAERTYGFTLGDRRVHFFDSKDKCNTVLDAIDRLLLDNTK